MYRRVLLVLARDGADGAYVAGALNLIGDDCIYGRTWGFAKQVGGCPPRVASVHSHAARPCPRLHVYGMSTSLHVHAQGRPSLARARARASQVDSLHFELCYYQAIEAAIELGLPRVEAGAQGEHKIARGYMPTLTYSAHHLRHPDFAKTVGAFLAEEREKTYIALASIATQQNPFKLAPDAHLKRQGLRIEGKRILVERVE